MSACVYCGRKSAATRCASGGIASTALMVLVPKCPMCIVAYIALVTGVGVSVSTAEYLRIGMMTLCVLALTYVAAKLFLKTRAPSRSRI